MANTINWNTDYVTDCLHEEAHCYGNGDYSVYFWQIDRTCSVFYVGCGKGYRFNDTNEHSRSKEFLEIVNSEKCSPRIVAYGMDAEAAREFEKWLIKAYWDLGFPLVNSAGIKEREAKYRREGIEKFNIGQCMADRVIKVDKKQFEQEYKLWKSGQVTAKTAMSHLGLKPNTFYRRVKAYEEEQRGQDA
ncbi:MAG: hypothetical protein WDA65_02875 [Christensenellales bacterium]